ncbi:MAG: WD40/YVTN/BNR-like repeat-containing protein, partial [Candidatus Kapaibacterium sp.]
LIAIDDSDVFVGSTIERMIYRSSDAGFTWNWFFLPEYPYGLTVHDHVLLEATFGDSGTHIDRSTDDGDTWSYSAPLSGLGYGMGFARYSGNILAGGTNLYVSTNEGVTWKLIFKNWGAGNSSVSFCRDGEQCFCNEKLRNLSLD